LLAAAAAAAAAAAFTAVTVGVCMHLLLLVLDISWCQYKLVDISWLISAG
jgi:hypothetical protein